MKSIKLPLIIVGAAVLLATLGLMVMTADVEEADDGFAASDADRPPAGPPVLTIGGKVDPDVYLQSLDIDVEVTGNIASTRYTMVFKNRTNRDLEGELTFPLPDGVTVTHHALDVNNKMREAVPVEKARAAQVFEEIQQRVQAVDPSILERVEGNNFRTRIYPFPRNGTRTISVGYEEELPLASGQLHYRLPMAYVNPIEKFSVTATVWKSERRPIVPKSDNMVRFDKVNDSYTATFIRENYLPDRAIAFALPAPADIPLVLMQSAQGSHYFLASTAPNVSARKKQWSDELAVIWDVSLSGSQRNIQREMEALDIIFAEKKNVSINLYCLNDLLTKIGQYRVDNGNWNELKRILETAVFDGGTDYSQIDLSKIAGNEILLFSDGLSTLSDADFVGDVNINCVNRVNGTNNVNTTRPIHAIISSPNADYSAMRLISGKTKGKFINLNALSSTQLKNELLNETLQFLGAVHDNSVREVYPSVATPVHGNFSIAGITDKNNSELTLLFGFGGNVERRIRVKLNARNAGSHGNVYRIWAQKKIAELDLNYDRNRAELTELGKQFGIVTRNTTLIVLELIDDYIRFDIEPPESEPELLSEYRRRRGHLRQASRSLLDRAKTAARDLRKWRGTDFRRTGPANPARRDERWNTVGFLEAGFGGGTDDLLGGLMGGSNVRRDDGGARRKGIGPGGGFGAGFGGGSDIGAGRKGVAGIGYGAGFGSGFGGGFGWGDHMMRGRIRHGRFVDEYQSFDEFYRSVSSSKEMKVSLGDFLLTGGRTRTNIERVFMQNAAAMRHAYNRRLREKPELEGTITVKFAIDDSGNVTSVSMTGSTLNDPELEKTLVERIRTWMYGEIDNPGDVTEVTLPVVFSLQYIYKYRAADSVAWERDRRERRVRDSIARQEARVRDSISRVRDSINRVVMEKHYMRGLTGQLADDYQTYLKTRGDFAHLPGYYFDMANHFHKHGGKETALRILTSIAELEIENASLYRMLGYRLKEYGEYGLQKFVFRKVMEWRPFEPQSYRDYALALVDNGEYQAALDSLYLLLAKIYSEHIAHRSAGIEEAVLMEMNRLIAIDTGLDVSRLNSDLLVDAPVDIRIVLNWNMDNVDVTLRVVDPYGEDIYYGNRHTRIGGRINANNTSGYGPEQFILKSAAKGKYRIYASHHGARAFAAPEPVTVMAEIYTKYAGEAEQRRVVCLQLFRGGMADVAEFDF